MGLAHRSVASSAITLRRAGRGRPLHSRTSDSASPGAQCTSGPLTTPSRDCVVQSALLCCPFGRLYTGDFILYRGRRATYKFVQHTLQRPRVNPEEVAEAMLYGRVQIQGECAWHFGAEVALNHDHDLRSLTLSTSPSFTYLFCTRARSGCICELVYP